MRTYNEALAHSKKNPTELVEFRERYDINASVCCGFLLNEEREGIVEHFNSEKLVQRDIYNSKSSLSEHLRFWPNGTIRWHYFNKNNIMHGEYIRFDISGVVRTHQFYASCTLIEELKYLINQPRDDVFYFTLAMYGIDKEYTF